MTTNLRAPDTLEPADQWRVNAICRSPQFAGHRDLWFPAPSDTAAIRAARKECLRCPVLHTCATLAIERREEHGVWGALSEHDRRRIIRRHTTAQLDTPAELARIVEQAIDDAHDSLTGPSVRKAFEQRTAPAGGGHTRWTVKNNAVSVKGHVLTPMQMGFVLHHGMKPEGAVKATCGFPGCVTGAHLADSRMRREAATPTQPRTGGRPLAPCGTPSAYDRHKRNGEPVDQPCREAHNERNRVTRARQRAARKAAA